MKLTDFGLFLVKIDAYRSKLPKHVGSAGVKFSSFECQKGNSGRKKLDRTETVDENIFEPKFLRTTN